MFRKHLPLIALIGCGFFFLLLFVLNKIIVSRDDFLVPIQTFTDDKMHVLYFSLIFAGSFVLLFIAFRALRSMPPRPSLIIIGVFFLLISIVAIATKPTRSQDAYHALLLGKSFSVYHLNPYIITPADLAGDPLEQPTFEWRDTPMVYGPLQTLFVSGVAAFFPSSVYATIILYKIFLWLATLFAGFFLWRIFVHYRLSPSVQIQNALLLMWNPLIIQETFIDAHSDIVIFLSLAASLYFFLKKKYILSISALVFGGFFKYVSLFLIPIPLLFFLKNNPTKKTLIKVFVFAIFFTAFTVLLYAPFGGFINTFNGVTQQIEHGGILDSLIGASIISFFAGPTAMRFIGIFLALGTLVFFLQSKKYVYAYTLPLVVLFFFGTRWFGSWYALWILPFFILFLNPPSFIVLSMILFLMPAVTPFFGSLLSILTIIMFIIVYKVLYYPRYISLRSLFLKKDYAA